MTNYYIEKENKIIFVDTNIEKLKNTVALGEYEYIDIKETERPIINFEFADTPEYIAEQLQKRKDLFYANFIKTTKGCIRLKTAIGDFITILPNYSIESMTTGKLTAGRILFYNEPNFNSDDEQLVSYPSEEMTSAEYMTLYMEIQTEYQKIFNKG